MCSRVLRLVQHAVTSHRSAEGYLGGEVLLSGEGLSQSTESMLDQLVQITWGGGVEDGRYTLGVAKVSTVTL